MRGAALIALLRCSAAFRIETPACDLVRREIAAFARGPQVDPSSKLLVASFGGGGLGDQASGFLGSLALAMLTSRRLAFAADDAGAIVGAALEPSFPVRRVASPPSPTSHAACADRNVSLASLRVASDGAAATDLYCAGHALERAFGGGDDPRAFGREANAFFAADVERVVPGNAGDRLLRHWFAAAANATKASADLLELSACALRAALKPSAAARAAAAAAAPWGGRRPERVVGVHVRAARYLRGDAYGGALDDAVFSCGDEANATDFADVFAAAAEAERRLGGPATWLLLSDSAALKRAAARAYPGKVVATAAAPRHAAADAAPCGRRRLDGAAVDVAAEMLLLAASDAIVAGASRFATVATFFCEPCAAAYRLAACPAGGGPRSVAAACDAPAPGDVVGTHVLLGALPLAHLVF